MTMFGYNVLGFGGGDSAPPSFSATGGTRATVGTRIIHTFTSSGDFVATGGATQNVDYLVIAGGGSGGGKLRLAHSPAAAVVLAVIEVLLQKKLLVVEVIL